MKQYKIYGKITKISPSYIEATYKNAFIGEKVEIISENKKIEGEVIGISDNEAIIMSFGDNSLLDGKSKVYYTSNHVYTYAGEGILGKVIDPFGNPFNEKALDNVERIQISLEETNPMKREKIKKIFDSGIRSINALATLGKGQRVGIFAGAGVGKTSTLGMIMKYSDSDIVVLALIGERGREVREYVEDILGDYLEKSVVVVSTSDQPPILKVKGVISAASIARYFAKKGKDVLLVVDSLTRLAMAQREIGLASGEPPTLKGYTPSVFNLMSKVIESCGSLEIGSITGIFSVLVEGDDISLDPIADSAVGYLDGHIILSRKIAESGIYPAVDPLKSLSRIMPQIVSDEHLKMANELKNYLSQYYELEDIIKIGLYRQGSNKIIDNIINNKEKINNFFMQNLKEGINYISSIESLKTLVEVLRG